MKTYLKSLAGLAALSAAVSLVVALLVGHNPHAGRLGAVIDNLGGIKANASGLDLNAKKAFNAGTPTAGTDLTTKTYVDGVVPLAATAAPLTTHCPALLGTSAKWSKEDHRHLPAHPNYGILISEDFMENGNVATGAAFGGGLFASSTVTPTTFQASTATEWGVQRFSTNTTTTGTAYVGGAFGTIPFTMATALPACFSAKVNLSANASPNIWRFGLQSGLSATPTDGVFLKADPATSANWICEVRSGNTPVNFTTSVATPTSAWTNLEWVKGEASDHYLMYADGVSLCDINATGVEPANRLDIFAGIIKTSGATVHQMDVDWVWYWQGTGPSKRASSNI